MSEPQDKRKAKALCVATRCQTVPQFIESFAPFCDETTFFVATMNTRPRGLETPFAILLSDRTPALRGLCVVMEGWSTPANRYGRPGIRLKIKKLTPDSEELFQKLQRHKAALAELRAEVASSAAQAPPEPTAGVVATTAEPAPTSASPISDPLPRPTPDPLRTPGSDLVLPANPLMNLTDASLEGFVDCTLYEETAKFVLPDDPGSDPLDHLGDLVEPPPPVMAPLVASVRATPPPFPRTLPTPPPLTNPPPQVLAAIQAAQGDGVDPGASAATSAASPPPRRSHPQTHRIARGAPWMRELVRRRWWLIAVGAAGVLGILVIAFGGSGDAPASSGERDKLAAAPSATTDSPGAEPPGVPPPAAPPTPPGPDVAKVAAKAPAGPDGPGDEPDGPEARTSVGPLVGDGPCRVDVTSTPAGARVSVDGAAMGPSPLSVSIPCKRVKVELAHPRYKAASQWAEPTQGKPATVDSSLVRPTHRLSVTSVPSGATVSIGGRRAGTTPTVIELMGFSGIQVTVTKTGFETVTTKVYSKVPEDRLAVSLRKTGKR